MASNITTKIILETIVKGTNKANAEIKGMMKGIDKAAGASKKFGIGLLAVGAAVGALGGSALKAAAQYEQSQIAFTTMLGSAEAAQDTLNKLADFAKTTPFELTGIEANAKQLLAMGIGVDDLMPTLKALGDVSAGLSVPLERLALNYGQVAVQGKLTGKELRDFAIAGVPLLGQLAEQLGKSKTEIQDMVSKGLIGFDEVEKAFEGMTSQGGIFNNLMDAQSKSLNGMISNLADSWNLFLRGEGEALIDWGKRFVGFAIHVIDDVLPRWIVMAKALSEEFAENKLGLVILSGIIIGALVPALIVAVGAAGSLLIALAPFMLAGAAIAGVIAGILWLNENWDLLMEKFATVSVAIEAFKILWEVTFGAILLATRIVFDGIKLVIKTAIAVVAGVLAAGMLLITGNWQASWEAIKGIFIEVWEGISDFATGVVDKIMNVINRLISGVQKIVSTLKGEVRKANEAELSDFQRKNPSPKISRNARGGSISAGETSLVGEEGPEIFTPLSSGTIIPNNKLGGATNVYISGVISEEAALAVGDILTEVLAGHVAI